MSNEKFTQGEWEVVDGYYPSMLDIKCGGKMTIPVVLSATDLTFSDGIERRANAHLISAAPDMYRALQKMIDMHIDDFGCAGLDNEVIDEACAALAKANEENQ